MSFLSFFLPLPFIFMVELDDANFSFSLALNRYDLVWTIPYPYTRVTEIWSEKCPGLDYGIGSERLKVQG